jgi:hypothetical protein
VGIDRDPDNWLTSYAHPHPHAVVSAHEIFRLVGWRMMLGRARICRKKSQSGMEYERKVLAKNKSRLKADSAMLLSLIWASS